MDKEAIKREYFDILQKIFSVDVMKKDLEDEQFIGDFFALCQRHVRI
jgi:hypothetical protein